MSKNKSKIVKWEYVTKPFDTFVVPATVKRVHVPLGQSLSPHYTNGEFYLRLRPCVQGVDEYGAVVKYLYCTRDGRFFVRDKDGWSELKPNYAPNRPNKKTGGGANYAFMRHYGALPCHLLVAHAWVENRYHYIKGVWSEKEQKMVPVCTKQVDHLDTNTLNNNASNLEYVDASENNRRRKITDRLKNKVGIDPKLLSPTLLRGIFGLPEDMIEPFISTCSEIFTKDTLPLSAEAIRLDIAQVLDILKQQPS